jgi:Secretion system C-terminal sorting domain
VANYGQANGLFNFVASGVEENTYKLKYYYRAPEGKGCHNSDSINVRVQFPPKVNLGPDAAACEYGAEFTINVADPPSMFSKYPYGLRWEVINQSGTILKETTNSLVYLASAREIAEGRVMVRVVTTNPGSCPIPATDTAIFTIFKKPLADFSGSANGNVSPGKPFYVTYTAAPSGLPNCNYLWYINNVLYIDSIEKTTFNTSFTTAGAYRTKLVVINKMTTCSDTSNTKTSNVWNVGVQNIDINTALSVYPNPSKTLITINNKTRNLAGREYRISNLVGQTLLNGKLGIEETQVNIESLSSGVYLLSIEGMSSQSIKVVKE